MKILCFGNEFVKEDSLAKEIIKKIKIDKIEFIFCNSPDILNDYKGDLIIMDVVKGIDKVTIFDNIDILKQSQTVSCHDFDLSFHLKLLNQLGQIKNINIIGLPMKGDIEKVKNELVDLLKSWMN